jgi:hypothetical protein
MDPLCRRGFPPDPARWQDAPYGWVADTVALRHSSRAFRDAELTLLGTRGAALAYLRRDADECFAVIANAASESLTWELTLPLDVRAAEVLPLRGGRPGERSAMIEEGSLRVTLPARDGMVVRLER